MLQTLLCGLGTVLLVTGLFAAIDWLIGEGDG